jgi:AGZA family xanthine/uracil permease-like MFS transporter
MIDMFDTMGTCVGCCSAAGLMDENGTPVNYDKIMLSDSVATCVGAAMGTSTVTTFVESGSGIAAGGRTGLTALTTAILFTLSIFLLPLFASIPGPAAASALIYVGVLMLKGIVNIKIDSVKNAVAAFLTIAMMPLAYSITDGIGFGIVSYVVISLVEYLVKLIKYAFAKGKGEAVKPAWELHAVTIIVAVLFLVYFFVPTTF